MVHIQDFFSGGVEETLLIPLWCRAAASRLAPEILVDHEAAMIMDQIAYDFSGIAASFQEYGQICCLARARNMDEAIRAYLRSHPQATVVNIGAGLDTTFSRVDNSRIRWVDLDLPEVIAARRELFPRRDRCTLLEASMFDTAWFDQIPFSPEQGIFFVAGGVFHYYMAEEIKSLVHALAAHFPGGSLFFDAASPIGLAVANRFVKRSGNRDAPMRFAAPSRQKLATWSAQAQVGAILPFFTGIKRNKKWRLATRCRMAIADRLGLLSYIRLDFISRE